MTYILESKWGSAWEKSNAWKVFDNLDRAINALKFDSNLSRIVCPLRVIDSNGKVYARYEPEEDMRFFGESQEDVNVKAYKLWEEAGRPTGDGKDFWYKAESLILKSKGVTVEHGFNTHIDLKSCKDLRESVEKHELR